MPMPVTLNFLDGLPQGGSACHAAVFTQFQESIFSGRHTSREVMLPNKILEVLGPKHHVFSEQQDIMLCSGDWRCLEYFVWTHS